MLTELQLVAMQEELELQLANMVAVLAVAVLVVEEELVDLEELIMAAQE